MHLFAPRDGATLGRQLVRHFSIDTDLHLPLLLYISSNGKSDFFSAHTLRTDDPAGHPRGVDLSPI